MRTIEEKIRYLLRGILLSDEPMKETILIPAGPGEILKAAKEMKMNVWIKTRAIMDPESSGAVMVRWVGLRDLPVKEEKKLQWDGKTY